MLYLTTFRPRPRTPEQIERMLAVWSKLEADVAARTDLERRFLYFDVSGSSGVEVAEVSDPDTALPFVYEAHVALSEFIDFETRPVLELDDAMPAILAAAERTQA
jgi:hypothetical protein